MPGGDRTGPMGAGPKTGRGAGYCAGYDAPGFANPAPRLGLDLRRGFGGGRGGGRHFPHRHGRAGGQQTSYFATPSPEDELNRLGQEANWLKGQLEAIEQRIEEIQKNKQAES